MTEFETTLDEIGLKFYFVLKKGLNNTEDVSNDMNIAYTNIREYFKSKECIEWLTESECLNMNALTKKDIFILQEFDGEAFEYLKTTKSLVIGPRCLMSCLIENSPIPPGNSPVFTVAMRDLIVCASGISTSEKRKMKNLVSWMGGYYCDDLPSSCTHLISNTVLSSKYEQAALNGIKIMHPNWVNDVWKRSQQENILAKSREFDKHILPIFYNLNVTTTGLKNDERNKIKDLVTKYGGNYTLGFKSTITDILILKKDNTNAQKYDAAKRYKKECLIPDWIYDSITKGYALPIKNYEVNTMKVSTPTKNEQCITQRDFNPNDTEISEISQFIDSGKSSLTLNETCSSVVSRPSNNNISKIKFQRNSYKDVMDQLILFSQKDLKKAGTFLDGCRIYLTGFTIDEKDKLNKILNSGGAIRYEDINENLTHIIVGEANQLPPISDQIQLMGIVKLQWLLESLKLRQPAEEFNFLHRTKLSAIKEPEAPSPSSKKIIQSMNHSFKMPATVSRKLNLDVIEKNSNQVENKEEKNFNRFDNCGKNNMDEDNDLLQQYKRQTITSLPQPIPQIKQTIAPSVSTAHPSTSSAHNDDISASGTCTEDQNQLSFFEDLAIYVHETECEELCKQLIIYCENAGGKVVSSAYKQIVDYVIVSSERTTDFKEIPVRGKNIVNSLWLEDAMFDNKLIEQQYFHKPIPQTADKKPLKGMNIAISIYTDTERLFLLHLIQILGAKANDKYLRAERPLLICPLPNGLKYEAAIRWKYPVVTAEWLVECAKQGEKIDLHTYLVGEASINESWEQFLNNEEKGNSLLQDKSVRKSSKQEMQMDVDIEEHEPPVLNLESENEEKINKKNINDVLNTPEFSDLRHRRLSELRRINIDCNVSPATENSQLNLSDFVKRYPTPVRQCIYNVCKEAEDQETPPSQKLRKLVTTPGKKINSPKMPESCTTPEIQKRKLQFYDKYYMPRKDRRKSTPLSEVKKKFWKDVLGKHFWEPEDRSQNLDNDFDMFGAIGGNSMILSEKGANQEEGTQNVNFAIPGSSTSSTAVEHINHLTDFIKNRQPDPNENRQRNIYDTEDDNERAATGLLHKFDSEMGGTEELVGWRDPSEVPARRNEMRHVGVPKFSLSCLNEKKENLIEKIKQLNGEICENLLTYDESCTHIVCAKPNRGEKILSCIAAGKWLLPLEYIDDSYEQGTFLNEELYEWGNPKATRSSQLGEDEKSIASAAYRWRTKLESLTERPKGVFQDFRCILHNINKTDQFQRVITAGGGTILDVKIPYSRDPNVVKATHCFVEVKTPRLTRADHIALTNANVPVLNVMYLNEYLTNDLQPNLSKFLVNQP